MLFIILTIGLCFTIGYMYNSSPSRSTPNTDSTSNGCANTHPLVVTRISEDFWIECGLEAHPTSLNDDFKLVISITNLGQEDIARGFHIGVICDGFELKQATLTDALPVFSEKQVKLTLKRKIEQKYIGKSITIYGNDIELASADYPLHSVARDMLPVGQHLVNKNVLLFGWRGSGKTCFLNHVLPVFTSYQPTLSISRPSDTAVTLALQKYVFRTLFRADLPLTLFDTYGLTNDNYGEAVFRFLIGGLLNVKHGPSEYGFTENEEQTAFAALLQPRRFIGPNPNVIETVLFFVPEESTTEQIDRIKYYVNIAASANKKVVVVVSSRSEEALGDRFAEISTQFAEERCHMMQWLNSASFIAQQQLLHIVLHCIESDQ